MSDKAWVTEYGMAWQPEGSDCTIDVERTATFNGAAVLRVCAVVGDTDVDLHLHPGIEITVSKGGRSIRVFDRKTGKRLQ